MLFDGLQDWLNAERKDKCSPLFCLVASKANLSLNCEERGLLTFGLLKSMTYANGVTDARTFDLDYRMTSAKDVGTGNIQYSSYGYNANNSLTSILDNVTPANNQTLQYNSADWLNFASGSYGTGINLTYDSAGNRLTYGATTYTMVSTNNRLNTTAGNAVTYTSAGNISAIATGPTFTYNKANQMATAVVSGTTSTYGYDAFGQRLKAQVGTTPVRILSYLDSYVLTESSAGTKTDYIYVDDMPIGALQPATSTVSYIHTDRLGTPQKASDASKTVVWNGAYNPNGLVTPTTTINMNLRNRGQIQDVTGFYHNGYRDYNPVTAYGTPRYLEADPIGLGGGINPFIYVNSNPFKYTDPWGLMPIGAAAPWVIPAVGQAVSDAIAVIGGVIMATNPPTESPGQCTEEKAKICEENLERDLATCRGYGRRDGSSSYKICEQQAYLRYSNCLSGRNPGINAPLPPAGTK